MTPVGLRHLPRVAQRVLLLCALALAMAMLPIASWGQLEGTCFVVALEKLDNDAIYARTVMLAVHRADGRGHVGVVLNKPSRYSMQDLFPGEELVKPIKEKAFFGGPEFPGRMVALVKSSDSPGVNSIAVLPGVWMVMNGKVMDDFISATPNDGRYYMGMVLWRPGELAQEARRGWVIVRPADPARIFAPDTSKLYDELVTPDRKPVVES